jgi:hypothetical protein
MSAILISAIKKQTKQKSTFTLWSLVWFCAFALCSITSTSALAQSCPGSQPANTDCVAASANKSVTFFSTCKSITNNHASGKAIMIPGGSVTDWSTFYGAPPAGVSVANCSSWGAMDWNDISTSSTMHVGGGSTNTVTISGSGTLWFEGGGGPHWYYSLNGGALTPISSGGIAVSNGDTLRFHAIVDLCDGGGGTAEIRDTNVSGGLIDAFTATHTDTDGYVCP